MLHCITGDMLPLTLDPTDDRPLYLQIIDEIRRAIVVGELREEDAVPSVRELAARLLINPRTVSQAYQELERENVLYVRRGQGTFVAPRARRDDPALARGVAHRALRDARRHGLTPTQLVATILTVAAEENKS